MSNWNDIRKQAGKTANKAIKRTGELAENAKKYMKLKVLDAKLSAHYEALGRLTYKQIKNGEQLEEKISESIESIDKLRTEWKALNDEIEADKKRRADEKKEKKEQKELKKQEAEEEENSDEAAE